ncbi:MAG: hypothetical protein IJG84_11190 [Kiritimatiellae bacterium]|nr:hypothetical protein [Kiritimatiellia bacterium]
MKALTMMGIAAFAAQEWGNPLTMVADAFGCENRAKVCRKRHEVNARLKADKARKAAKKARRRNRR